MTLQSRRALVGWLLLLDLLFLCRHGLLLCWLCAARRCNGWRKADETQNDQHRQKQVEKRLFPVEVDLHSTSSRGCVSKFKTSHVKLPGPLLPGSFFPASGACRELIGGGMQRTCATVPNVRDMRRHAVASVSWRSSLDLLRGRPERGLTALRGRKAASARLIRSRCEAGSSASSSLERARLLRSAS